MIVLAYRARSPFFWIKCEWGRMGSVWGEEGGRRPHPALGRARVRLATSARIFRRKIKGPRRQPLR